MNSKLHTQHVMKQVSSTVEDVPVLSYSMDKNQKRFVVKYSCDCSESDTLYRELDKPGVILVEYTKEVMTRNVFTF